MNEVACEVVRDLMPMVVDEVASEESQALVRAHMAGCAACRDYYAGMTARMERSMSMEKDAGFIRFSRKMWKKIRLKWTLIALLAVIGSLSLVVGAYIVQYKMNDMVYIPVEDAAVTLYREDDDSVGAWVEMQHGQSWYNFLYTEYKGGVIYLQAGKPALPLWNRGEGTGSFEMDDMNLVWADGALHYIVNEWDNVFNEQMGYNEEIMTERRLPVESVRWGSPDNFTTLYERGDVLPTLEEVCDAALGHSNRGETAQKKSEAEEPIETEQPSPSSTAG